MKKKIVQISSCGVENTSATQCNFIVTALTEDGEVYINTNIYEEWIKLPDIVDSKN